MIRIVYTNMVCTKYNGACSLGSHDECRADCRYQVDKGKVPVMEKVMNYNQKPSSL